MDEGSSSSSSSSISCLDLGLDLDLGLVYLWIRIRNCARGLDPELVLRHKSDLPDTRYAKLSSAQPAACIRHCAAPGV